MRVKNIMSKMTGSSDILFEVVERIIGHISLFNIMSAEIFDK